MEARPPIKIHILHCGTVSVSPSVPEGGLYPNCTRYWLLNGVKVDNPVTIVKHTASQGGERQVSETL